MDQSIVINVTSTDIFTSAEGNGDNTYKKFQLNFIQTHKYVM